MELLAQEDHPVVCLLGQQNYTFLL